MLIDFDQYYGVCFKVTEEAGNPSLSGFSIVTPENGNVWFWKEKPEFKVIVRQRLNDPGWLSDYKKDQIVRCIQSK